MAFEGLTGKLQSVFDRLRGKGKITEEDLDQALRDVRLALLEADVNFKVVKEFIASVREKAIGREVHKSFTPAMVIIDVVHKELTALMGGAQSRLSRASRPPTVVMAVGLQGAGKTTTCAKLARHLQKQHARPLLVAADVYRPAAAEQLKVLGGQIGVDVFLPGGRTDPVEIAASAVDHARAHGYDYVVVDTAGRLHVDEMMMDELRQMRERIKPDETLLVVDAMTGQEAVRVAETFHRELSLTGVVLTKLDGDTRGGAALSVKAVTGCPIKFAATGEKIDALEPFHPDRMASRILGMGDMLTLIEKAQAEIDAEKAKEMERKIRSASFTFDDFLEQMEQLRKLGPLDQLLDMLPGASRMKELRAFQLDEKKMARLEAIVKSMTKEERANPDILNASRRQRIARGSGNSIQDVNRFIKQFEEVRKMMKQMSSLSGKKGGWNFLKGKGGRPFRFPF